MTLVLSRIDPASDVRRRVMLSEEAKAAMRRLVKRMEKEPGNKYGSVRDSGNGQKIVTFNRHEIEKILGSYSRNKSQDRSSLQFAVSWISEQPLARSTDLENQPCLALSRRHESSGAILSALQMMQKKPVTIASSHSSQQAMILGIHSSQQAMTLGMARSLLAEGSPSLPTHSSGSLKIIAMNQIQFSPDGYGTKVESSIQFTPRLLHLPVQENSSPYQLSPEPRGALGNLKPLNLTGPGLTREMMPGTIMVKVKAVGINFRDVLNVLGLYPGDPGMPGGDCAGVVIKSGHGSMIIPGTPVFGLAGGCLGSHVVASSLTLVPIPPCLSFEAAATTPTVYITTDAVLRQSANLRPGEILLLPAAAGGVGLSALQDALSLGGRVVATAGGSPKRSLLRGLGVEHVANSRDTSFVEDLYLQCQGVDVVLNNLTSPGMISASLSLLKAGGRFVEIGKRDIFSFSRALQERPDISFSFVAVDFMPESVINAALLRLSRRLAIGELRPLPRITHSMQSVASALRQMSQAKHIGKVVVSNQAQGPSLSAIQSGGWGSHGGCSGQAMILGGTGSLGSLIASWLAHQGCKHLLLIGRSGRSSSSSTQDLTSLPCSVTLLACDASFPSDLESIARMAPSAAIFHAGGVLADATLQNQTLTGLRSVLAPKVSALRSFLDQAGGLGGVSGTHVLFSSVASLLGSPGQSNYCAANSALDASASSMSQSGISAISIQWGAWAGGGMADAGTAARVERMGMKLVQPDVGLAALGSILSASSLSNQRVISVTPFLMKKFVSQLPGDGKDLSSGPPLFLEQIENFGPSISSTEPSPGLGSKHSSLKKAPKSLEELRSSIVECVQKVIGSCDIPHDSPLMSSGLDSLGAVELRNSLEAALGVSLPGTLVFDYPTIEAITSLVIGMMPSEPSDETVIKDLPPTSLLDARMRSRKAESIVAVIGYAAKSPMGIISDRSGILQDAITLVPTTRWDIDLTSSISVAPRFGGYLDSVDCFDPTLFGISVNEALLMDPQQRLLLELTLEATSSLSLNQAHSTNDQIGVAIGIASAEYNSHLLRKHRVEIGAYSATGGAASAASGRLSFTFNFSGPSLSIDTACSSSLVALSLMLEHVRAAPHPQGIGGVVGGVGLLLNPEPTAMFDKAGMLSPEGRCKTLDDSADGYVRSEAASVLALGMRDRSTMDGILAVISGSAVNQDGRSSSLTAPNGPAQQQVIQQALRAAGMTAGDISLLEMHGTGTPLGDPIEIGAASAVLCLERSAALTALVVKSRMGHSEAASGLMGLFHAMNSIKQQQIIAVSHYHSLNPYVSRAMQGIENQWAVPRQRCSKAIPNEDLVAGVSSFAFQGTNCHVIVSCQSDRSWRSLGMAGQVREIKWDRSSLWPYPFNCPLSSHFAQSSDLIIFHTDPCISRSCFLEHRVAGVSFLPSSFLLSIASSLTSSLIDDSKTTASLSSIAFPSHGNSSNFFRGSLMLSLAWEAGRVTVSAPQSKREKDKALILMETSILHLTSLEINTPSSPPPSPSVNLSIKQRMVFQETIGLPFADLISPAAEEFEGMEASMLLLHFERSIQLQLLASKLVNKGGDALVDRIGFLGYHHDLDSSSCMGPCHLIMQDVQFISAMAARQEQTGSFVDLTNQPRGGGMKFSGSPDAPPPRACSVKELECLVKDLVSKSLGGTDIPHDSPLMSSGLDSLGAVELRNSLEAALGVSLPTTLLYDAQTIDDLVGHVLSLMVDDDDDTSEDQADSSEALGSSLGGAVQTKEKTSSLLKVLRSAPRVQPLFLAAPGVANAQAAYFAFSKFLDWSNQPIYVLEKDNGLSISQLALANAKDIVIIQPKGPYLLGGHSYGGCVAFEIALILESWGHQIAMVVVIDTPRREQIRPLSLSPDATCTDEDALEMMEMILGALGNDVVGLGGAASLAHPKESEEWKAMSMQERYAFFSPIWRVMRDDKMTVEEVQAQIEHVSLAVKVGSEISDMRHHQFSGKLKSGDLLYFRAENGGACSYFDDSRTGPYPHGDCWGELCDSLEVVNVPGDHFSLLRQPADQMQVMLKKLQQRLGDYGWVQIQEKDITKAQEGLDMDLYLERMGVPRESRLKLGVKASHLEEGEEGEENLDIKSLVAALNMPAEEAERAVKRVGKKGRFKKGKGEESWSSPIFFISDSGSGASDVTSFLPSEASPSPSPSLLENRPLFSVSLPSLRHLQDMDLSSLAAVLAISISNKMSKLCIESAAFERPRQCSIMGVGFSSVLAHEVALKLMCYKYPPNKREARRQGFCEIDVSVLVLVEDSNFIRASQAVQSPSFLCADLVAAYRPDLDLGLYWQVANELALLSNQRDLSLEYLLSCCPSSMDAGEWAHLIEEKSKPTTDPISPLELASWTALYSLISTEGLVQIQFNKFLLSMHRLRGACEAQLDWVTSLCSENSLGSSAERLEWERQVHEVIYTSHFLVEQSAQYQPSHVFAGERLLFVREGRDGNKPLSSSVFSSAPLASIRHQILPIRVHTLNLVRSDRKDQLLQAIAQAEGISIGVESQRISSALPPMNQICPKGIKPNLLGRPPVSRSFLDSVILATRQWGLPLFLSGSGTQGLGGSAVGAESESGEEVLPPAPLVTSMPLFVCFLETKLLSAELSLLAAHLHVPAYAIKVALDSNQDDFQASIAASAANILSLQPTGPWVLLGVGIFGGLVASSLAALIESQRPDSCCLLLLLDGSPHIPSSSAKTLIYDVEPRLLFQAAHSLLAKDHQGQDQGQTERLPNSYYFFLTRYRQHLKTRGVATGPLVTCPLVMTLDFMKRYCPPSISVESWEGAVGEALAASVMTISLMTSMSKKSLTKIRGSCGVILGDHSIWLSPSAASVSATSEGGSNQSSTMLLPPLDISDNKVMYVVPVSTVESALRATISGSSTLLTLENVGLSSPSGRSEASLTIASVLRDLLSLM